MTRGTYIRTEEHRQLMRLRTLGTNKGLSNPMFGKTHSDSAKSKISAATRGHIPWNKGGHLYPDTIKTLSEIKKGRPSTFKGRRHSALSRHKLSVSKRGRNNPFYGKHLSLEHREKIRIAQTGEKNAMWRGGITAEVDRRTSSAEWKNLRKSIYARDVWTCQMCLKHCGRDIQCHHLMPYRITKNDAESNLITLCRRCHTTLERYTDKVLALNIIGRMVP